jgi:hypothetical protein
MGDTTESSIIHGYGSHQVQDLTYAVPVRCSEQYREISPLIYSETTLNSLNEYVGTIILAYAFLVVCHVRL